MGNFDKLIADMDASLFDTFSKKAIYKNSYLISVVIDKDVEQFGGFDTTGPARRHEISFMVCEVPSPKRGDTIETEDGNFVLDGSISNDGFVARWHINES